jgi:predicted transcriptional regulator
MASPAHSLLETVTRRAAVIERLSGGLRDKRELTEGLDVSRQTVDRTVRELESVAIVERTDEGYRLTLVGELAYREFESLLTAYERLCLARDLLVHLPPDTRIDTDVLAGATVVHADHRFPRESARELERLVQGADSLVGYSPIAVPEYVSLFHHQVTRTDTEIELFLDEPLIERLVSGYTEELREALSAPNFTLFRLSESLCPNMGIALADGSSVWIGVYDDTGNIRGAITTEADAAVAWARDRLEACRENGQGVPSNSAANE